MATIQEAIKRLRYVFTSEGADKVVADQNKVASAVVGASSSQEKAALSLDKTFAGLERRYNTQVRAQQDYDKVQRQVNAAVAANPALQDRANAVLAEAAARYGRTGTAARLFAQATSGVSGNLIAMSAGLGPVGVALAGLHPLLLLTAAAGGFVVHALAEISAGAHELAQKAIELQKFSDTTGLTTLQVQALRSEASKFALSGDEIEGAIRQFTARFNELRVGQGELLTQIRRVNPALADQMAGATDAATALTMFGRALQDVDNVFQRNALVKAATGRGGLQASAFLSGLNVQAISQSYSDAGKGIDQELIAKLAKLEVETQKYSHHAKQNISSIFAESALSWEHDYEKAFDKFTQAAAKAARDTDSIFTKSMLWVATQTIGMIGAISTAAGKELSQAATRMLSKGITPAWATMTPESRPGIGRGLLDTVSSSLPGGMAATTAHTPQFDLETLKKQISAMGDAATFAMREKAALDELATSEAGATLSAAQMAKAQDAIRASFADQRLQARVSQLGELATVTELNQVKEDALQKLLRQGVQFSPAELAAIRERNNLLTESSKIENQLVFDREQLFKSQTDQSIDATLRAAGIPPASERAAAIRDYMRMTAALSEMRSVGLDFTKSFVQGLIQTHDVLKALKGSLDAIASKMADKAIEDLFSGNLAAGAIHGAIAIGSLVASSLLGEDAKLKQAQKDWEKMQDAARDFVNTLSGAVQGDLTRKLTETLNQGKQYYFAALQAHDYQSAAQLYFDYLKFVDRQVKNFRATFEATLTALSSGQGSGGASITAIHNVAQAIDEVQGFITDTQTAGADVSRATDAARQYLLTLITGGEKLSDVGAKLAAINSTADALAGALTQLGLSGDDAAKAIASGVSKAIADLKGSFENDLSRQINEATGRGFINQFEDLFAQVATARLDASALGSSQSLIDRFFTVSAQKLVDESGLVGDAFNALIAQFPQLTGVIHESTAALEEQRRAMDANARSIVDYVNGLLSGTSSALSPQARLNSAQSVYNTNLALAQGGNQDSYASITKDFENYRAAAQAFYGSSTAYQNILQGGIAQLLALPAVAASTDPVVSAMRDVLTAINTGNAAQATNATLLSVATNTGNLLTSAQLSALGLATNATAGSIVTNTGNLLTSAQLSGLGLALNATTGSIVTNTGALLTSSQLAALGLSLDVTSGQIRNNVLTQGQLSSLGLATNATVGSLLTQSQLSALGLAANTTVSGLLTAAQLAQAGLATNPTLINTNTAIGTLLTQAQLQASGLAANTTVSGLLTAAQLAQAGLATNAVAQGLLTQSQVQNLGLALNTTASGLLTQAQVTALGLATNTTASTIATNTGTVAQQTGASGVIVSNLGTGNNAALAGNDILTQIKALNDTSSAQLQLLNTQYASASVTFQYASGIDANRNQVVSTITFSNTIAAALEKIVFNTYATSVNTQLIRFYASSSGGLNIQDRNGLAGQFAQGGTIPPYGLALVSEHLNPTFLRAGPEPIQVFPGSAANDNGAVVAELRALRQMLATALARIAQLEGRNNDLLEDQLEHDADWRRDERSRPRAVAGR